MPSESNLQTKNLPPPFGKCVSKLEYQFYNGSQYSKTKCNMDEKSFYVKEKCGCKDFYMPPTTADKYCSVDTYLRCVKKAESKFEPINH